MRAASALGVALALLIGCAARPVVKNAPAPPEAPVPPPPEITPPVAATPPELPLPLPPCLPAEPPKPKHRFRHKAPEKAAIPTPPPAAALPAAPPAPGVAVNAQVGELASPVMPVLGRRVQGPKGEDLGRVVDVLADADGRVRVAIIDFGGFLGVGTRRIAVEWPLLHFDPVDRSRPLTLEVTRQKLQAAPEFKDSSRPRVLMPPPASAPATEAAAPGAASSGTAPGASPPK